MRILAVGAHPDDIEFMCAGTLAKFTMRGDQVIIAVATNGEVGSMTLSKEEIARIRRKEAENSAAVIGAEFIWMNIPDEFLFDNESTRLKFIEMIRKAHPDIIITHWPEDPYHPDHSNTGKIVNDVCLMVTVPNIETESPPCKKIPYLYYADAQAGVNFIPEEYVDITDTFEIKKKMLSMHKSQEQWLIDQYNISPLEFMEIISKFRGIQCGCRYAEGFRKANAWPRIICRRLLP
jgi:LmbE family N-acetylglucosaminyl deacetylase